MNNVLKSAHSIEMPINLINYQTKKSMKKMLTIAAIAAAFTACKKDLSTTPNVVAPIENGTNAVGYGYDYTSYDDYGTPANNGGYWNSVFNYYERVSWTYYMANSSVTTKFAQNISGRANAPTGWQRIDADKPNASNNYGAYMRIQSYNPSGGSCFPYPKIQMATVKEYNKISRLQSSVNVSVPTTGDRRFNTAFDIYFDKAGQQYANYLAMMVWLNKSWTGQSGPAGERLKWWNTATSTYNNVINIDGVDYYLIGRKAFTNNDMIINFVRVNETTADGNINILNLMRFLCPQGGTGRIFHYTDGNGAQTLQPNLSGANLVDYNFGFEIWKAVNTAGVDRSQKALTFTINRFVTDFAFNP